MVFPGRFSTGCLRCRQRKVKCDEGKPSCRRCIIYGKPCTGYTDQFRFRYCRNNSTAATTSKPSHAVTVQLQLQPQTTKSSGPQDRRLHSRDAHRRPSTQSQSLSHHATTPLARAPQPPYDHISLSYFVNRFVSPDADDGYPAHLSFLPDLYDRYRSGLLEMATLSVAQMAAYNKFGGDSLKVKSYQNYGRAIHMLQDAIQLEDQATDDKVIAAILLLCILKDLSGEASWGPNVHAPGLFYLIEKRGLGQMATSRGSELLFLAIIRLQINAFLSEDDSYVDPGAIVTCWGAFNPLLRAVSLMSRTLSLRHKLLFTHPEHPDYQTSVVRGCFETLDDFQAWDAEAVSHWATLFMGRGTAPAPPGQVASVAHYDVETACTIILIRSARLILLVSMIAYIDMAEWTPVLEREVGMVISDMLACVPHALGRQDPTGPSSVSYDGASAVMILQPLRLLASCAYTTPEQLQSVNDTLARLSAGIGIRGAGSSTEDLDRATWAKEQAWLRERMAARVESAGGIETEVSPLETESSRLLTPLSLDPPRVANVGCASY